MSREQKLNLFRIIASLVLLVTAMLMGEEKPAYLWLCLASYAIVAYSVLWTALRNIAGGQVFDENFLMAVASLGAFFTGNYSEAVAVMVFYRIGELFEEIAVGKSRRSIAALMDIRPDHAVVLRDGVEQTVSPEQVRVGEHIVIRPGERIPLDGVVCDGTTTVNTSSLTGESLPADKTVGDTVISGCVNISGLVTVEVKSEFAESTVSKILEMVENSAEKKTRSESFITRFARYYTPCVVIAAVLLALIAPLFFAQPWNEWINRALIFLVVSCPCALVVSVPLSFFGGIGGASKLGILIKGSSYLEALSKADTVVFDKTGTLTEGSFTVTAVHPESMSEEELLSIAACAESYSTHPIAESIIKAHGRDIDKTRIGGIKELAGRGLEAEIDGQLIYVGNYRLMEEVGAKWLPCEHIGTIVHVALKNEYLGHIVISDEIKSDAKRAIKALGECGVKRTVMLTGDMKQVGEAVSKELGLSETYTKLLPGDKVEVLEKLLSQEDGKHTLVFVGDGINDAPVLTRADLGIAMGALGSDAAIEAADVVLMDDKPSKIAVAIKLARKTMRIVRENIAFSLGVKGVVLLLGAAGYANMWFAVFGDVGVLIIAIINAMRALDTRRLRG